MPVFLFLCLCFLVFLTLTENNHIAAAKYFSNSNLETDSQEKQVEKKYQGETKYIYMSFPVEMKSKFLWKVKICLFVLFGLVLLNLYIYIYLG